MLENNDFCQVALGMGNKKDKKKAKPKEKKITSPPAPAKDESFDFGGLPDRNLKKNLGCG